MATHGRLTRQLLSEGTCKTRRLSTLPKLSVYQHASINGTLITVAPVTEAPVTEAPVTEAPITEVSASLVRRFHYQPITRRKTDWISKNSALSSCCVTQIKQLARPHVVMQKAHGETIAAVNVFASVTVFAPCVSLNERQANPRLV